MAYTHNTYDRRIQLGASRRRREDAENLLRNGRWAGAVYLGGYAIECALKSSICYNEEKNNIMDTRFFQKGVQGATLHDLRLLLNELPHLQRAITTDRTGKYKAAWSMITTHWQKDQLRYWDQVGDEQICEQFLEAINLLHTYLLRHQGE
jgi:hypothetical protein